MPKKTFTFENKTYELNPSLQTALEQINKGTKNLFITGRAGTGKSTLLRYIINTRPDADFAVLAPTGIAAINIGGETIHHFLKIFPGATENDILKSAERISKKKNERELYRRLKTIIIDEISMVRADLMDALDIFLRKVKNNKFPFGGTRIIAFGDLYQLPPIVTSAEKEFFNSQYTSPYFFGAQVFKNLELNLTDSLFYIELDTIYRQKDSKFISLLQNIRTKDDVAGAIKKLNQRVISQEQINNLPQDYVHLATTNKIVDDINESKLAELNTESKTYHATIYGDIGPSEHPTNEVLKLKIGARVMLLNNDPKGRWVNGTLGKIEGFGKKKEEDIILVQIDGSDRIYEIEIFEWEKIFNYFDDTDQQIKREVSGSFVQFPLKLAWAITIHRSQGQTFNKVLIDFGSSVFAQGQSYVALSRATDLEHLYLKRPLRTSDVRLDYKMVKFLTKFQTDQFRQQNLESVEKIIRKAISQEKKIKFDYVKANNQKMTRTITPDTLEMMVMGKTKYYGVSGFDHDRQEDRVFNVERILQVSEV